MPAHSLTFSPSVLARTKLVLMGPPGALHRRVSDSARSLKETEYVAVDDLYRGEMTRQTPSGAICSRAFAAGSSVPDEVAIGVVRRWFWSRKSSRAFVLAGFPATVAHAVVFDEWLDNRDEALTACVWLEQSQASALAEADDAHVCPHDGAVFYPTRESLVLPGRCDRCNAALQPDGDRARADIRAWFAGAARDAKSVASHYRSHGLFVSIDADRPLDAALAEISALVSPLVADR